ncbi:hypothetical protein ABZ454_38870 [Streptomyces sp. NPDC005803]|uniref:hypothetical protein n=1 Tax=Streptomyces sp. NPDC005803 TaxID=3154297 RepID=UPI0033CA73B5
MCRPCETRIYAELGEVADLWHQLPALLAPGTASSGGGDAPRAPGPTGSKPPGSLAVLSLLGGGVTDLLLCEEDAWRRELGTATPRRGGQDSTLRGTVEWLRLHVSWACHTYTDVDDLDRTLRKLLGEMRGLVSGDRRRREDLKPGCPMTARGYAETDSDAPTCGGKLTYDPRKTVIRCNTCRRAYGPADWFRLGAAAGLITLPFTVPAA